MKCVTAIPPRSQVDITPAGAERPARAWVTPSFARMDLTNARAGTHTANTDEGSTSG